MVFEWLTQNLNGFIAGILVSYVLLYLARISRSKKESQRKKLALIHLNRIKKIMDKQELEIESAKKSFEELVSQLPSEVNEPLLRIFKKIMEAQDYRVIIK